MHLCEPHHVVLCGLVIGCPKASRNGRFSTLCTECDRRIPMLLIVWATSAAADTSQSSPPVYMEIFTDGMAGRPPARSRDALSSDHPISTTGPCEDAEYVVIAVLIEIVARKALSASTPPIPPVGS